ncbi:chromate resistance protein ChrB domain-containing protein [Pseudooceanicola sp.]|uniref:chromate resistance protein ChrB domain-containing protein n=1 Tax=Pseudooceanicola sp. TaxID=1914328 RepID=UPI0035C6B0F5
MPGPTEITSQQLLRLIGTSQAPVLIDVRTDEDFDAVPRLIPGARRIRFDDHLAIQTTARDRPAVIVCHRGQKLSQGAAALLRASGTSAETLAGGMLGWTEAQAPTVDATALPGLTRGGTLWVTRHRPKIDRIACPWLIRRFVDPTARVLFVAPSEVMAVAEKFDATPFDVENVRFSHRDDLCTFDTMLSEFGLHSDPLDHIARVIRAADTDRHDLAPEAAGLLAISVGLSRLHRDDIAQMEAGLTLYDALYRWARDGRDETHDWPGGGK